LISVSAGLSWNYWWSFNLSLNIAYSSFWGFSGSFTGTGGAQQSGLGLGGTGITLQASDAQNVSDLNGLFAGSGYDFGAGSLGGFVGNGSEGIVTGGQFTFNDTPGLPGTYENETYTAPIISVNPIPDDTQNINPPEQNQLPTTTDPYSSDPSDPYSDPPQIFYTSP
jgi:hypothetical protein